MNVACLSQQVAFAPFAIGAQHPRRDRDICVTLQTLLSWNNCSTKNDMSTSFRNKGIATRNKDATRGSWPYY